MRAEHIRLFEGERVPRYTSYPTAPHFGSTVGAADYATWLSALPAGSRLSLYLHVPYCRQLCWYCGCHTYITQRAERVAAYLDLLEREIDLVADLLPAPMPVIHLHFGGGTPSVVGAEGMIRILAHLRHRFTFLPEAELAIELDPRMVDGELVAALAEGGINRASLGVQTTDPEVQKAVNRVQPLEQVTAVFEMLRASGIGHISVDLLYGLPRQTVATVRRTARDVLALAPDRAAVFGYAHLPRLKRHQTLIPEETLPGAAERAAQFEAIAASFEGAGYLPIGLDHFARPGDAMARAAADGSLRRNFQGYTTDPADALLGFGCSAIGELPQGYVQNATDLRHWRREIHAGRPPIARGLRLSPIDRAIRAVIERIMCFGEVDLERIAVERDLPLPALAPDAERMDRLVALGIAGFDGRRVTVPPENRPLLRLVAAAFDRYLEPGTRRHAVAI